MPRALILVALVVLLVFPAWSQAGASGQNPFAGVMSQDDLDAVLKQLHENRQKTSGFKTLAECQSKEQEWEQWASNNIPKCEAAMKDADKFEAESTKLRQENQRLRSDNESVEYVRIGFNLFMAAVGIGIGVGAAFYLARALRRFWRVSARGKQLAFMVLGAFWITGAAVVAVNDSDLIKHPVNMLFTVLVYSIPALAFSGIGFWWFGRAAEKGQAVHG